MSTAQSRELVGWPRKRNVKEASVSKNFRACFNSFPTQTALLVRRAESTVWSTLCRYTVGTLEEPRNRRESGYVGVYRPTVLRWSDEGRKEWPHNNMADEWERERRRRYELQVGR